MRGYPSRYIKSTQNSQLFRIPSHLGIHLVTPKALKFSTFQDIFSLGYPSRYTKSTQNSQFFRPASHLGIHLVTPNALKILNFSEYPLTWISMSLHQKHTKFSIFQASLSPGYPSRYTKSTQNSELFRIYSHLDIHVVIPKALKFSTSQDILSLGYPSRYTKCTQNRQLCRVSSYLGIHVVSSKALKIVNFSGYPLTWVSMFLHQKHSKFSIFKDIFSLVCPCGYTKSTKNPQFL